MKDSSIDYADLERRWHEWRIEQHAIFDEKRKLLAPLADRIAASERENEALWIAARPEHFCHDCGVMIFTGRDHECRGQ